MNDIVKFRNELRVRRFRELLGMEGDAHGRGDASTAASESTGHAASAVAPSTGLRDDGVLLDKRRYTVSGLASRTDARRLERRLARLDDVVSARVRFEDGLAFAVVRASAPSPSAHRAHAEDDDIDEALVFVTACEGFELRRRAAPTVHAIDRRDVEHAQTLKGAGISALAAGGLIAADLFGRTTTGESVGHILTAVEVVLVGVALWASRGLWAAARNGGSLVPRLTAVSFAIATLLALGAAVTDFFLEAHPRLDVAGILVFGYEAALLMMSLLLREAEEPYRRLWALRPTEALVKRDGSVYRVRIDDVTSEDRLVVETGARVPVDGTVLEVLGDLPAVVDSTELLGIGGDDNPNDGVTGERVRSGDRVLAGSVVSRGKVIIEPLGREQSLLYRLLRTIEIGDERSTEGPSGRGIDWGRLATSLLPMPIIRSRERLEARYGTLGARHARFVVIGLLASAATLITWLARSHGHFSAIFPLFAPAIAIAVLAGAWVMAWGPILATVSALGSASRRGVLFRNAAALDAILDLDLVVFASEGTLTVGEPAVQTLVCHEPAVPEARVISYLLTAMFESEEPIADSIRDYAASRGHDARGETPPLGFSPRSFRHLPGQGVIVVVDAGEGAQEVLVGRASLLQAKSVSLAGLTTPLSTDSDWLHLAVNGKVLASLHIHDSIRPECARAGQIARSHGRKVALLDTSGGQGRAAQQLGCSKSRALTVCGGPEDHAAFVAGEVDAGRRVGVVGRLDGDRMALEDATMRIGILPKSGVIDDAADVLLLKPGVQGFITAVRAARSARFGARFSVLAGVVGLLAAVPAALGYLEPAGAAMVSLGLLVVTGLVVRVRSRWLD